MSIRFIDTEDHLRGDEIVAKYLAKKYIEDLEKKEKDAAEKKKKEKKPITFNVVQTCMILVAAAPFVAMGFTYLLVEAMVRWRMGMETLLKQLQ